MKKYLSLVKFSHTIFALPFALLGFYVGTLDFYQIDFYRLLGKILLCMVFARSSAMAFNRYLDREIDALNIRTKGREIPTGKISPWKALLFTGVNAILFVATTWWINPLVFYLSPIALLIILGYSYTKRFTWWCHLILGLGLSLAPVGAYLSVTQAISIIPFLYGVTVLTWVAGFDIIYALQDDQFDRFNNLKSIPEHFGRTRALRISEILHIVSGGCLLVATFIAHFKYLQLYVLHWIGVAIFIFFLLYQHRIVKPNDLSRVNHAFFTMNGLASVIFSILVIADLWQ
jgi:4-hydroxybenzoate polyprenyltransferase